MADALSVQTHGTDDSTSSGTEFLMKDIRNTQRYMSFGTYTISYVTNNLEGNKSLREEFKKDEEFKELILKLRSPLSLFNGLLYLNN